MKKFLAALVLCLCALLVPVSLTVSARAESVYENTWYALRNARFAVPDYKDGDTVTDPGGEPVVVSDGKFRASLEGDYIINQSGRVSVLRVYRTAPKVTIELGGDIAADYCAGETVYLPSAKGMSEIKDYTDYSVEISVGGEVKATLLPSQSEYAFPAAGEYKITYVITDVFGLKSTLDKTVTVSSKPVIVMQRFPETLAFGSSLKTDATYGYYDGVIYECKATVKDKLGTREIDENLFVPACDGISELTFTCEIGGEKLSRTVKIEVVFSEQSFFVTTNINSVTAGVPYPPTANADKDGVFVCGDSGSAATFTKALNLKELSEKGANIIEFQPYAEAGAAISEVRVVLTDAYDASNTLGVYWWKSPWNEDVSYMLVEYDGQGIAISNESKDKGVVRNQYGTVTNHAFGEVNSASVVPFNFRYDLDSRTVYSAIKKSDTNYKVLDTDDTAELKNWKPFGGFDGEEVYLTVELTTASNAGVVISEIGGEKLDAETAVFENKGVIQLLRDSGIEEGVVDYGYILPYAKPTDIIFGDMSFARSVEVLDGGEYRKIIGADGTVEGNVFTPKHSGEFRAVFSGRDNFGKEVSKVFSFRVKELPEDIFIVTNAPESVEVRSDFILPAADISGGTGELSVRYQVRFDGKYRYMQPNERIYADRAGNIDVSVIVKDELGFVKTTSYSVKIETDRKFIVISNMPLVCVNGEKLQLPEFTGLDYSKYGTAEFEFPVVLYVNESPIDAESGYTVNTTEEELTLKFAAADGSVSETRSVRVIPSQTQSIADKLVFDRQNVSYEFYETGLTFSSASDFGVSLPYALPYSALQLKFTSLEEAADFAKIEVVLTGNENESQKVTLSFSSFDGGKADMTADGVTYRGMTIEGGTYGALSSYNGKKYNSVSVSFAHGGALTVNGVEIGAVKAYDSGRAFDGFDGGKVRIAFRVVGVGSGPAKFILNTAANQSFNSYTRKYDEVMPVAGLMGDVSGDYEKGSAFEMPKVVFGDVLSYAVTGTVSVFAPDGTAVISNAALHEKLSLTLDSYGYYRFEYTLTDGEFNTGKRIFRVFAADVTPPEISFDETVISSATSGDTLIVPSVTITDDNESDGEAEYYIYIRDPDTLLTRVRAGESVKLDKVGIYKIIVYATDGSGNVRYEIREIKVS